jgi:hypothetical protein
VGVAVADYLQVQVVDVPAAGEHRVQLLLNRPGFGGGIDPTKGWSHVSAAEVSA